MLKASTLFLVEWMLVLCRVQATADPMMLDCRVLLCHSFSTFQRTTIQRITKRWRSTLLLGHVMATHVIMTALPMLGTACIDGLVLGMVLAHALFGLGRLRCHP